MLYFMFLFGRDRKVAANQMAVNRLRMQIRRRNLAKELIRARIKQECWDSMEVQKKEVQYSRNRSQLLVEAGPVAHLLRGQSTH